MVKIAVKMRAPLPASTTYPFALEPLPFAWNALEPHIDAETMRLHYEKHHQAYVTQLNAALKDHPELHAFTIEELLNRLSQMPGSIRQAVRNHGGGHLHHKLFWKMLKPGTTKAKPSPVLQEAIERELGSFEAFMNKFIETGTQHFGAGWVFLAMNSMDGKLEIFSRSNQDSILPEGKTALLINDLWEHAYYLKYRNARANYLKAFWNIVNWEYVDQRFEEQIRALSQASNQFY